MPTAGRAADRRSAAVITDRDLAPEYARRHRVRRRRRDETAAEFRCRVVRALYAAGEPVAAEQVLLNDQREPEEAVVVQGTLGRGGGDTAVRQLAERIQAAVDQAHPPRPARWLGSSRPRNVHVHIDPEREGIPAPRSAATLYFGFPTESGLPERTPLTDLGALIIERIQAAAEQARPRARTLWLGGWRPLSVHVHITPWPFRGLPHALVPLADLARIVARWQDPGVGEPRRKPPWSRPRIAQVSINVERPTDPAPQGDLGTDRDLAEDYAGQLGLDPRRDGETGAQFRERVTRELFARGLAAAAQGVLFNDLTDGGGLVAEALLEHSGGDEAVRWICETTQAARDQARLASPTSAAES
jgi:hypothetical protein